MAALILSLPVTIIAAIAIKLDSEGPIFYIQDRLGKDGVPFRLIKFRTMVKDAEEMTGPTWSTEDDDRVTRVGKVLRALYIDEIPQFINILKGDMSVVGPRPERKELIERERFKRYPLLYRKDEGETWDHRLGPGELPLCL